VKGTCSVDGCARTVKARGFCHGHWRRWRNTGDPGPAEFRRYQSLPAVCVVDGCDRSPWAHGWCQMHRLRWHRSGDPGRAESQYGSDGVGYSAAHWRVYAQRGRASEYRCVHCGSQAEDWAYDHCDPHAKRDDVDGRPYSLDPLRYLPLCSQCHTRFDRSIAIQATVAPYEWAIIRAWAKQNGWNVAPRGRLAKKVIVAYRESTRR
jgi:choline dehydrogenase-like flavoprotein